MKIFDKNDKVIENPDLEKGYLITEQKPIICRYHKTQEEIGHYEVIRTYDNGGQDVEWVIDTPEEGEWIAYNDKNEIIENAEFEIPKDTPKDSDILNIDEYQRYIEYTLDELVERAKSKIEKYISELQENLRNSDYNSIKFIDNISSCTNIIAFIKALVSWNKEYRGILDERRIWREKINRFQEKLSRDDLSYEELEKINIDNILTEQETESLRVPIVEEIEEDFAAVDPEIVEPEVVEEEVLDSEEIIDNIPEEEVGEEGPAIPEGTEE